MEALIAFDKVARLMLTKGDGCGGRVCAGREAKSLHSPHFLRKDY